MSSHATRVSIVALAVGASLAVGCEGRAPAPPPKAPAPELRLHGVVALSDPSRPRSLLAGAAVSVHSDRDRNGKIEPNEKVVVTTDAQGGYSLRFPIEGAERVVLTATHALAAKSHRTLGVGSAAELGLDIDLAPVQPLTCERGACVSEDGRLRVTRLPANVRARGRSFDPTTEKAFFPGSFSDKGGNLLVSGAFSSVELVDQAGQPVTSLAAPAELRMPLPRTTWSVVTDIHPNSGKIEYPLYSFDEVSGDWVREGEGVLEGEPGDPIPEASLAAIRAGTFARAVAAVAKVTHFSFWNVDWPIATFGCVTGIIVDEKDTPLGGATVVANGLSYVGTSMPRTTGADGWFCTEAMRSEAPGEDVDLDGQPGEAQKVAVVVARQGIASVTKTEMPRSQSECGGGCLNLGRIRLATRSGRVAHCRVEGRTVDAAGAPVAANVSVSDDSVANDVCGLIGGCRLAALAGDAGQFELRTPLLSDVTLVASRSGSSPDGGAVHQSGSAALTECPASPVSVVLVDRDPARPVLPPRPRAAGALPVWGVPSVSPLGWVPAPAIGVTRGKIIWEADREVSLIRVVGANGRPRWLVEAPKGGFKSPVIYGQVPADAVQRVPEKGRPARLAKGDVIRLEYVGGDWDVIVVE